MHRHDRRVAAPAALLPAILLAVSAALPASADEEWPQFRGARGSASIAEAGPLGQPDLGLKVTWRAKLGFICSCGMPFQR